MSTARRAPVRYIGFWPRALAQVVDNLLASVLLLPMVWVHGTAYLDPLRQKTALDFLLGYVVPIVLLLLMWRHFQSSPGKRLIRAKIVDAYTLGRPSDRQLIIRLLGYIPSILALGLGCFAVFSDPRRQAWHDRWADTLVIEDDAR